MTDYLEENISIGYKVQLPEEDCHVVDRLMYHGRLNGELSEFLASPMYFYDKGELSSVFMEHIFINGDSTWELAAATKGEQEFYAAYLEQAPVVLLCRVTLERPLILDMARLGQIADDLNIAEKEKFVANFEDSDTAARGQVFSWTRRNGYDGVVIVNDMTPEAAGGDWCFRTSYVAFDPSRQVRFAFQHDVQPAL